MFCSTVPTAYPKISRGLVRICCPDDYTDAQAIAAIERITRGNFRLLERLLPQIQRVLKINDLNTITNDVIEAARSTLVIGTTTHSAAKTTTHSAAAHT